MMYHEPVLLKESVDGLNIQPNGIYVDATYGGGGHSREILSRLETGKLLAFDMDEDAKQNQRKDERLVFIQHNFRFMRQFLTYYGINQVDGILADLGVSSHQFDEAGRGFSFRNDADLDMRMNRLSTYDAKQILNNWPVRQLAGIFLWYGELPNANRIARSIEEYRNVQPLVTIGNLLDAIRPCIPSHNDNKFLAQVFQAIRIEVNHELENLKDLLKQAIQYVKIGGRLSVITYHSLEDRIVKNFVKTGSMEGKLEKDFYGNQLVPFKAVNRNIIVPSNEEMQRNNRARSAKLRIAERV